MRQPMRLAGRGDRLLLLLLALLLLSALALYAWSSPASSLPPATASPLPVPADSLLKDGHYVGPPSRLLPSRTKKLKRGERIDLNAADSLTLLRVPGVGATFAHRILLLRRRLGGYYTLLQLQEVYGVDEDKFLALRPWFVLRTPPKRYPLPSLEPDSLPWHPYLSRELSHSLQRLLRRHGAGLTWTILRQAGGFTWEDSVRLSPYFPEGLATRD